MPQSPIGSSLDSFLVDDVCGETLDDTIKALDITVSGGINWTWATWKPDDALAAVKADTFNAWAMAHGYETRGVYPPLRSSGYGVRFR